MLKTPDRRASFFCLQASYPLIRVIDGSANRRSGDQYPLGTQMFLTEMISAL